MPDPTPIDALPPEARFVLRALVAGLTADEIAAILGVADVPDGAGGRVLRRVVRAAGGPPLTAASGDETLRTALAPALVAAQTPPSRKPGTACPSRDILRALARGELDGPLLLAEAEHAADCPSCMAVLVAARREGPVAAAEDAARRPGRRLRSAPLLFLLALAGVAGLLAYLFLR